MQRSLFSRLRGYNDLRPPQLRRELNGGNADSAGATLEEQVLSRREPTQVGLEQVHPGRKEGLGQRSGWQRTIEVVGDGIDKLDRKAKRK